MGVCVEPKCWGRACLSTITTLNRNCHFEPCKVLDYKKNCLCLQFVCSCVDFQTTPFLTSFLSFVQTPRAVLFIEIYSHFLTPR